MDDALVQKLKKAGFKVTNIQEALDLTDADVEVIELMLEVERKLWSALAKALGERDGARIGRDQARNERDEAKQVIGQLGGRIEILLQEGAMLRKERDQIQQNYANAIGPR